MFLNPVKFSVTTTTTRLTLFYAVQWTLVSSCLAGALSSLAHCCHSTRLKLLPLSASMTLPSRRFLGFPFVESTSAQALNADTLPRHFSLEPSSLPLQETLRAACKMPKHVCASCPLQGDGLYDIFPGAADLIGNCLLGTSAWIRQSELKRSTSKTERTFPLF